MTTPTDPGGDWLRQLAEHDAYQRRARAGDAIVERREIRVNGKDVTFLVLNDGTWIREEQYLTPPPRNWRETPWLLFSVIELLYLLLAVLIGGWVALHGGHATAFDIGRTILRAVLLAGGAQAALAVIAVIVLTVAVYTEPHRP